MVASNRRRRQLLRYISPEFAGFVFSADWGALRRHRFYRIIGTVACGMPMNSMAFASRVALVIHNATTSSMASTTRAGVDLRPIQHTATGFFVAGSYGEQTDNNIASVLLVRKTRLMAGRSLRVWAEVLADGCDARSGFAMASIRVATSTLAIGLTVAGGSCSLVRRIAGSRPRFQPENRCCRDGGLCELLSRSAMQLAM